MSLGRWVFRRAGKRLTRLQKCTEKTVAVPSFFASCSVRNIFTSPRLGEKPTTGFRFAHIMDRERLPMDVPMPGQEHLPLWLYRAPRLEYSWFDRYMCHFMSAVFWWWVFYRMYWDYGMLVGEHYFPGLEEFTDEELGIPPDDAPDPEYWGYQQEWTRPGEGAEV